MAVGHNPSSIGSTIERRQSACRSATGMSDQASSTVGYTDKFMEGARRYDFGERSNFILLPMMSAALNQVLEWRPDNIQQTIAPLIADINRRGQALELRAPEQGVDHFTGLRVRTGRFSQDLQRSLSDAHVHEPAWQSSSHQPAPLQQQRRRRSLIRSA